MGKKYLYLKYFSNVNYIMSDIKDVFFKKSPNKNKKLRAIFITDDNKRINVDFGASGYKDFIIYNKIDGKTKANDKRKAYIKRHSKNNENWNNPFTAGALSRWILWEKPTLHQAIANYRKKFNI